MANADGRLFNIDRWGIYTLQKLYPRRHRYSYLVWGNTIGYLPMTPTQIRRCKKKMRKNNDYSIGIS